MLDSEARSTTLDDDANHGRTREPLLKIMHLYRSMQLSTATGYNREVDMIYLLERRIGQEAFRAPSVFGFFLNEYSPVGPVLNKGLVAPETQLFDAPKLISFINGLFSLPAYGLSDCVWWQGFGDYTSRYILPGKENGHALMFLRNFFSQLILICFWFFSIVQQIIPIKDNSGVMRTLAFSSACGGR